MMGNSNKKSIQNEKNDEEKTTEKKESFDFSADDVSKVELIDCGTHSLIPSDLDPDKDPNVVKILCISDTHSKHAQIRNMPSADILVHAGDFTNVGSLKDIKSYDKWIKNLILNEKKYKYAVLVAGNHDITLEEDYYHNTGYLRFHHGKKQNVSECNKIAKNGHNVYIEDKEIELFGVKLYGSPYQPEFCNWAFNLKRGKECADEWEKIPSSNIDVLITHGPPKFHGDKVVPQYASLNDSEYVGCDDLLQRVNKLNNIKYHIFGHIHEGYGVTKHKGMNTIFVNASTVNVRYQVVNKPIMIYVKGRGKDKNDVKSIIETANHDDDDNNDDKQENDDNK